MFKSVKWGANKSLKCTHPLPIGNPKLASKGQERINGGKIEKRARRCTWETSMSFIGCEYFQ
jgi:hypothetical protein